MLAAKSAEAEIHFNGAVMGRYVLGDRANRPGVNIFACRLQSITPWSFIAAAPVTGEAGEAITATFAPFGTLKGSVSRVLDTGFEVGIEATDEERADLEVKIEMHNSREWTGVGDKRAHARFMPGEPRSVIVLADGRLLPCLVVDYSISGVAVSADVEVVPGMALAVGAVVGRVVRKFEVGFAVRFAKQQDPEDVERLLEAPEEWLQAVNLQDRAAARRALIAEAGDPTPHDYAL